MSKKIYTFKQFGTTGLRRNGSNIYEEFLPELRWPRAGKIYQEMSDNDAVIGSILYLAEMLIRGVTWSVKPASKSDVDIEAAKFVEESMNDMEMSWANVISEILSMISYGFSFHEVLYKVRRGPNETSNKYKSKYSDGRISWRAIPIRSQVSLDGWIFNEENEVVGFVQVAEPNFKRVVIPMSKGLLFRTKVSRDNPEGRSSLRNAYRSWFFKKHFEEIEGIGIERDLAGFPVLHAPEDLDLWNDEDPEMVVLRQRAEELVSSIRRDSEEGALLPHGWELDLLTSGSSRQIDIGSTIERYDNRIAITLLSDIVLLGSKSGSFALSDTKQSMLGDALQTQVDNIADVFNSNAVPQLFRYNTFEGITGYPTIVPGRIQSPSFKELALMLRAMGLNIAGDYKLLGYLRNILCLPALEKEEFEDIYLPQMTKETSEEGLTDEDFRDDTSMRSFEQNDMNYTGGEM